MQRLLIGKHHVCYYLCLIITDTISDFISVSKEYCRKLIMEKGSFPSSRFINLTDYVDLEYLKFKEGSCPRLDSFIIPSTLSRLESIIIDSNCACSASGGMGNFALNELSSLREVIIDDGSFISYVGFSIKSKYWYSLFNRLSKSEGGSNWCEEGYNKYP